MLFSTYDLLLLLEDVPGANVPISSNVFPYINTSKISPADVESAIFNNFQKAYPPAANQAYSWNDSATSFNKATHVKTKSCIIVEVMRRCRLKELRKRFFFFKTKEIKNGFKLYVFTTELNRFFQLEIYKSVLLQLRLPI
jgi:hypothetical protein